jgi:hypothetical protein
MSQPSRTARFFGVPDNQPGRAIRYITLFKSAAEIQRQSH